MTNIDWNTVRKQYVHGVSDGQGGRTMPTLAELARIHGLSVGTLRKRSAREKWGAERKNVQDAPPEAATEADGDKNTQEAAGLGIAICLIRLGKEKCAKGDSAELERLSRALDRYYKTYSSACEKVVQSGPDQATGVLPVPSGVDPEEWRNVLAHLRQKERQ